MPPRRVLVIGLDGYELSLAEDMMSRGLLPNMRRLRQRSARFLLDHGLDKLSGLAWDHISTGQGSEASGRWSAVNFDPSSYNVQQEAIASPPFLADLSARSVVFDVPYCDLARAPRVRGLSRWGAHDPGVARAARPEGLHAELAERFGPYPAEEHIYGFVWQSAEKTRVAAEALEKAVRVRTQAARWLFGRRTPDWDLGVVVVSEAHSALEPMWHGVDPTHPLHNLPSGPVAREGVHRIYGAIDDLIGALAEDFPDASLVVFSMHGMGANEADVAGMALLGELLYREAFGRPYMRERPWQAHTAAGVPLLREDEDWHAALAEAVPWLWQPDRGRPARRAGGTPIVPCNLEWMPVARYRLHWPRMKAFALPAFYDGRIRINLQGREARGLVPQERYNAVRDELVALLRDCRDPLRGERAVAEIYLPDKAPRDLGPTEADLSVVWRGAPLGLVHPRLGQIGPIPYRRTGGHTGSWGFAYLAGEEFAPGDRGTASSFDVVPTIIDLLGERAASTMSGRSLVGDSSDPCVNGSPPAPAQRSLRRIEFAAGGPPGRLPRLLARVHPLALKLPALAGRLRRALGVASRRHSAPRADQGLAARIRDSGLFDDAFYRERNPDVPAADAALHYLTKGAAEGRDPHPLFDTSFYCENNPDVAAAGVNPLLHYLTYGAAEGRDPHPLFDTSFYCENNPDVAAAGLNPLVHYLTLVTDPPRIPSPAFDPDFYLSCNPDLPPGTIPLLDYAIRSGRPAHQPVDSQTLLLVEAINAAPPPGGSGPVRVSVVVKLQDNVLGAPQCIRSLRLHQTRYRFEIVILDDAPGGFTPKIVSQLGGVRYLHNDAPRGSPRSLNEGVAAALGEYLVLLAPSAVVLPGWLDELIDTLAGRPRAGLVGSKCVGFAGTIVEAGGMVLQDGSTAGQGRGQHRHRPEHNFCREVDYCSATSLALRRSVWRELNGFDEALRGHAAADFAFRARARGHEVVYQPLSEVAVHEWGSREPDQAGDDPAASRRAFLGRHQDFLTSRDSRAAVGRVLFVDSRTPTIDQDSGSRTALDLILLFQRAGYQTTFVAADLAAVPRYTADLQRQGIQCLSRPHTPSVEAHLQEFGRGYDLVVLFRATVAARCLEALRTHAPRARVVLHTVDLHYLREQRRAALWNDDRARYAASRTRDEELATIRACDGTIVVSEHEKALLAAELPGANVFLLPYIAESASHVAPFEKRDGLLFVGSFNHPPNRDAVEFFIRDVFPLVRERIPGVRLRVVGSPPPADLNAPGVEVVGHLPDLTPAFDRCRLSVAPLRYGAGIKGKVVTSMSFGVPCVASPTAAEGMGLRDGEEILVANGPEEFADTVVRAYTDAALWRQVSTGGRNFVGRNYSPEVARQRVREVLQGVGLVPQGGLAVDHGRVRSNGDGPGDQVGDAGRQDRGSERRASANFRA